jgi:hypothetical protein
MSSVVCRDRVPATPAEGRAFRHALGHDLLKSGASLVEIRDVVRHRDIATIAAYTRVDVSALLQLARPGTRPGCWPLPGPAATPARDHGQAELAALFDWLIQRT